jgi:CRP-like cAMP-binding protein
MVSLLNRTTLFSSLSSDQLVRVTANFVRREVRRRELITLEGKPTQAIYVVANGCFKRFKTSSRGREQILYLLVAHDSFGEVSVLDGEGDFATTEALTDSLVYGLPRSRCIALLNGVPEFAQCINQCLASRVRQTTDLVESLSFQHTTERLVSFLVAQSFEPQAPHLTHSDIANVVGTSREVVTRALRTLKGMGAISVHRGTIRIVDGTMLPNVHG